jgi:hypothetical protein
VIAALHFPEMICMHRKRSAMMEHVFKEKISFVYQRGKKLLHTSPYFPQRLFSARNEKEMSMYGLQGKSTTYLSA